MTNHHPAPELLTAFSAGSLQLSQAICVSTHIEHCDICSTNLRRLNSMGAALFESQQPQPVSERLKDAVLAQLDQTPMEVTETLTTTTTTATEYQGSIPRALRQFIPQSYDDLHWEILSPSIRTATLWTDTNGARVEMLRIKPGGKVATHTHTGDEYTVILEGSFSDETGVYRRGDFVLRDGKHQHKPVATKDRECICLTVTDAPIRFTGFFARLLNPFVRKRYPPI